MIPDSATTAGTSYPLRLTGSGRRADTRRALAADRERTGHDMITKFDSLYAGHVDMDDIGYGGAAVNSRVFPNEHLVTTFAKSRNLARLLDRRGYDTFWLAEHHFPREGFEIIPNGLLLGKMLGEPEGGVPPPVEPARQEIGRAHV